MNKIVMVVIVIGFSCGQTDRFDLILVAKQCEKIGWTTIFKEFRQMQVHTREQIMEHLKLRKQIPYSIIWWIDN